MSATRALFSKNSSLLLRWNLNVFVWSLNELVEMRALVLEVYLLQRSLFYRLFRMCKLQVTAYPNSQVLTTGWIQNIAIEPEVRDQFQGDGQAGLPAQLNAPQYCIIYGYCNQGA